MYLIKLAVTLSPSNGRIIIINDGDPPPFWYAVSYADIKFYFKKVNISSRNTTNVTNTVK